MRKTGTFRDRSRSCQRKKSPSGQIGDRTQAFFRHDQDTSWLLTWRQSRRLTFERVKRRFLALWLIRNCHNARLTYTWQLRNNMAKKGVQNQRGVPEIWDELKRRCNLALTPTAIKGLDELAKKRKTSRSELVERIGRGLYTVNFPPDDPE